MIKLSDYFAPLIPFGVFYFLFLFLFFDILGNFVADNVLKIKNLSRIVSWMIGLGIFVFMWFVLSFIIPPTQINLFASIFLVSIPTLPSYLKNRKILGLISFLWENRLAVLLVIPFLPSVFVKASLPPYYGDEMAYHFVAPSALKSISVANYTGGIYADLPRMLDFFWQQVFTLFKTYSVARLFHFTILASSMLYAYSVLKRNFGYITGFLFVLMFFSLPQEIVLTSTLGYIDVGAYSFMLVAIAAWVDFLLNPDRNKLDLVTVFWAMNLGTKYTGLSAFISFLMISLALVVLFRRKSVAKVSWKDIFRSSTIFAVFGGYWYIKNLVLFGNPIFPFIFECWGNHIEQCPATGGFFGDWTTKINLQNFELIITELIPKNRWLQTMIFMSPLALIMTIGNKTKVVVTALFLNVFLELLMLKYFSGFYVRYHQHMQLYLMMAFSIFIGSKKIVYSKFFNVVILITFLTSGLVYTYNVKYFNSLKFLNWNEISYSVGKIDIYRWVEIYLPKMNTVVKWCENPGVDSKLARFDPDLIWFDYEGYVRSFTTNCDYINPPVQGVPLERVLEHAKDKKLSFWLNSKNECAPNGTVAPKHPGERPDMIELRKLNNLLVCNSREVGDNLYYFDYSALK